MNKLMNRDNGVPRPLPKSSPNQGGRPAFFVPSRPLYRIGSQQGVNANANANANANPNSQPSQGAGDKPCAPYISNAPTPTSPSVLMNGLVNLLPDLPLDIPENQRYVHSFIAY